MTGARLAVRADGGAGVGAGHVMRSLAIADAWRAAGGSVDWFCAPMPPLLAGTLTARGIARHDLASAGDWSALEAWVSRHPGTWVVVDGYGFAEGPARLQAAGARVLVIDDNGKWPQYQCDVLLNQNPGAESIRYPTTATVQLLGPSFALLREEFRQLQPPERTFDRPAARVLVSFGGHDEHQLAARVARLLVSGGAAHIDIVSGVVETEPATPAGAPSVQYHTSTNLAPLMRIADVAVVAAGSICWELAYLGVPVLGLVVAQNQETLAEGLDAAGAIRSLGWYNRVDDEALSKAMSRFLSDPERAEISRRGRELIDGLGVSRVLDAILHSSERGGAIA